MGPTVIVAAPAAAQGPPFAAVQVGTNGCIEVGVRPDPPFNQPRPYAVPEDFDVTGGYPAYGYDPSGFTQIAGTNSCRYTFKDNAGATIGSGVLRAVGRRSTLRHRVRPAAVERAHPQRRVRGRILTNYWPATNAPAVPSTNTTIINRLRSGTVSMAIHYFTDGILMPPNYQDQAIYNVVRQIVTEVLAAGPLPEPANPTPTIDGPSTGQVNALIGPFTIGANALGDLTVQISGADAFTDAAGTVPFPSGGLLPAGGQLWIRAAATGTARQRSRRAARSTAAIGTLMVGDPAFQVQRMMLAQPLTLDARASHPVTVREPVPDPRVSSVISSALLESGDESFDRIAVDDLPPGATGTLSPILYGPVPPDPDGGCAVDWTGAPVREVVTPTVLDGDGVVETIGVPLREPGCYSYGATLVTSTAVTVTLPPGDPSETVLVGAPVHPADPAAGLPGLHQCGPARERRCRHDCDHRTGPGPHRDRHRHPVRPDPDRAERRLRGRRLAEHRPTGRRRVPAGAGGPRLRTAHADLPADRSGLLLVRRCRHQ